MRPRPPDVPAVPDHIERQSGLGQRPCTPGATGKVAMSGSAKAVFLSYASQDAGAARRICEALRSAGIEVWFDQSELRVGDAWDQKIRQQIHDCALFVPVISKHINA